MMYTGRWMGYLSCQKRFSSVVLRMRKGVIRNTDAEEGWEDILFLIHTSVLHTWQRGGEPLYDVRLGWWAVAATRALQHDVIYDCHRINMRGTEIWIKNAPRECDGEEMVGKWSKIPVTVICWGDGELSGEGPLFDQIWRTVRAKKTTGAQYFWTSVWHTAPSDRECWS